MNSIRSLFGWLRDLSEEPTSQVELHLEELDRELGNRGFRDVGSTWIHVDNAEYTRMFTCAGELTLGLPGLTSPSRVKPRESAQDLDHTLSFATLESRLPLRARFHQSTKSPKGQPSGRQRTVRPLEEMAVA
jgi:hypothetical protein